MGRLQHNDVTQGQRTPDKARPFHTLGVTPFVSTVMLGTALTFGGAALGGGAAISCLLVSRPALAQEEGAMELGGKKLQVVKLRRTLAELQEQNKENGVFVSEADITNPRTRVYTYTIVAPDHTKFLIALDHKDVYKENRMKTFTMVPAEYALDDPNAPGLTLHLSDFAKYVKDVFGKDMIRVRVILKTGTFRNEQGETVSYINPFVFPLDVKGNVISGLGNGQYVAFVGTRIDSFSGDIAVISEPGNRDTLAKPAKEPPKPADKK